MAKKFTEKAEEIMSEAKAVKFSKDDVSSVKSMLKDSGIEGAAALSRDGATLTVSVDGDNLDVKFRKTGPSSYESVDFGEKYTALTRGSYGNALVGVEASMGFANLFVWKVLAGKFDGKLRGVNPARLKPEYIAGLNRKFGTKYKVK